MTTPKVGSRDSRGRYWDGKQYVTLDQVMKNYNKERGYNFLNRPPQQGTSRNIPGVGEIRYDKNYGWQTKASYEKGMSGSGAPAAQPPRRQPAPTADSQYNAKNLGADQYKAFKGGGGDAAIKQGYSAGEVIARGRAALKRASGSSPAPENRPAPATQTEPARRPAPTPQASPVAKYMAAAAAARKIQDPVQRAAEMEKVKQSGLDIWKSKYAKTLAKNVKPDGTQRGTGQSEMEKQAQALRNTKVSSAPESGQQVRSRLPGGNYSVAASSAMTPRTKQLLGTQTVRPPQVQPVAAQPAVPAPAPVAKPAPTPKPGGFSASNITPGVGNDLRYDPKIGNRLGLYKMGDNTKVKYTGREKPVELKKPVPLNQSYQYEPYDLVLEYLLSEGHADTVEEAHYVMMQMSAEHIQDIVEGDPSFAVTKSSGVRALSSDAAKQLGPKAEELRKKEMGTVALPKLPPA